MSVNSKFKYLLLLALFCFNSAQASNRYYADNALEPTEGFVWDWSFGLGYYVANSYLAGVDPFTDGPEINVNLAVSYNKFYFDADNSQLSGNFTLGYSLVDKYDWGLDIIGTNLQDGFNQFGTYYNRNTIVEELAGIKTRDSDFDVGFRLTRRISDSQLSFELLQDVSGSHHGWAFNSFVSNIQTWRNWEFRAGAGLNFYSAEFVDYYFGISNEEVTATRPLYQPGIGVNLVAEFHAEYPINENWVFLAGWLSTWFSTSISESPIVSEKYQHKAKVGVRYVF
ncbi:MipA/OmpV family protein [Pseudoalteromonas tunicata]|uniref:MipA/OmpV family protein n=1 Tax=Pseudoalteromonas tunicata TaxID=314281 RepID=UPI00273F1A7C|nr:MipA/OmpV family protein [Pseudoalteromonas tunicata]MDP5213752.1 MipA/OmpV family protein [Pseudoalteromonas tunicata]